MLSCPDPVSNSSSKFVGHEAELLAFQVASIKALEEDVEMPENNLSQIPDSPYKDLLAKFPNLLKQDFNVFRSTKLCLLLSQKCRNTSCTKIKFVAKQPLSSEKALHPIIHEIRYFSSDQGVWRFHGS